MKIAIMQPYFLPYIGYFQLINAVDKFVIYDNIEYTKKGWINRNRILVNGADEYISLPIKKGSDFLDVKDRFLADSFDNDKKKICNKIKEAYRKAPYFTETYSLIEAIFKYEHTNLFEFIFHSIKLITQHIGINTEFIVSSTLPINHHLKAQDKVLSICEYLKTESYINPIGGLDLYKKEAFKAMGFSLFFLKTNPIVYKQFNNEFLSCLSIIDVLMFQGTQNTKFSLLNEFKLME